MSRVLFLSNDREWKDKSVELMKQRGLVVDAVADCLQGLPLLNKEKFDAVVIDDDLSDLSSLQACRIIRQQTTIPIVLTGTAKETETWANVGELGFDIYLQKRAGPGELLTRLEALLRQPAVERKAPQLRPISESSSGQDPRATPQPGTHSVEPQAQSQRQKPAELKAGRPKLQLPPLQQPALELPGVSVKQQDQTGKPAAENGPDAPLKPSFFKKIFSGSAGREAQQSNQAPHTPAVPVKGNGSHSPVPMQAVLGGEKSNRAVPNPDNEPLLNGNGIPNRNGQSADQQAVSGPEDTTAEMFADGRILKLVDALVNGKLTDIVPVVDFNLRSGYSYPGVEGLLDISDQETIGILDTMANNGILIKQQYEKFYVDPDGSFQLVPVEHCPRDDSANLVKGQLVEHFSCGYVGLDRDFRQESRYICPKCRKEMRLIGTDYRNIGIHYRCMDDGEVFTTPIIKWRNLKTRKEWAGEELREIEVYSYRFNHDKKGWLEFQLKPKAQLVDFLRSRGYNVQEFAQLKGRSGAMHVFDILAVRDDILTKIDLGIGILAAAPGEPDVSLEALFRFDTRAYDAGITYKVVIAIPKLGREAANFASRQMINAFEARTMASVVSDITSSASPLSKVDIAPPPERPASAAEDARSAIVKFLRNKGYEVYERALIAGKSGVEHVFDIFSRTDDKIIVPTVAVDIVSGTGEQPVGMDQMAIFDAAAFDSGVRNKVFLGLSPINMQARQFAKQQKIDVVEQGDLARLVEQ